MARIKTNKKNQQVISLLTKRYKFKDESMIARIAIAYSLQKLDQFELDEEKELDHSGKEYAIETLLKDEVLYRVLLNQYYKKRLEGDLFFKLLKFHLDSGLSKLNEQIIESGTNHIDLLVESVKEGLKTLDIDELSLNFNGYQENEDIRAYTKKIVLDLGLDLNHKKLQVEINNQENKSNQYIAIAGTTGAGKTELVKDLLWQIYHQTNGDLKFIFFDPKGEGQSHKLKTFLDKTECCFVDVSQMKLPFNPLLYISLTNESSQKIGIQNFRDTITSVNQTGPTQKSHLSNVMYQVFHDAKRSGKHPTIQNIRTALNNFYQSQKLRLDNLTAIFDDISNCFTEQNHSQIYQKNHYINLPANMPDSARQTLVFLMLNYLKNIFMPYSDTNSDDSIKPMRYVIVVDEAHVYLKNKDTSKLLESLLRMIRSKGVMIVLMTQSVEDYKQKNFDFSSQIGTSILLDIEDKNDNKYVRQFLGIADTQSLECLKDLSPQKGIVNEDSLKLIDVNLFFRH